MTALQTINLGTAPAGSDGDSVRTAFVKDNSNVTILQTQLPITSATLITTAQALTTTHIGKRVNINLGTAGTINLPAASTCAVDQVTLLRNLGTTIVTLAITTGSGDTVSITKLNPGETALMDTDGVHTWTCLMRGRTNSDNETVNGNCAVVGNETVGGALTVTGGLVAGSTLVTSPATADSSTKLASTANTDAKIVARNIGRTLIATQAANSVNQAFVLSGGYSIYELVFSGAKPLTDNTAMGVQISFDGGTTWVATANYTTLLTVTSQITPATTGTLNSGVDRIQMFGNAGNTGLAYLSGTIRLQDAGSANLKSFFIDLAGVSQAGVYTRINGAGHYVGSSSPITAIRLISGSGSNVGFSSGTFSLYGWDK
ncbi:hypothetical protein PQR71_29290 [Paraburkholderia fungorum]|uniref:hypothetical protein n=1 Tax=Paraburkholderia fungorum TaxID=134537 RepID=UPI0038B80958